MKKYGVKEIFCIEYEEFDDYEIGESILNVWINGLEICSYEQNGKIKYYHWNLRNIVEWLKNNMQNILFETEFPLPINATSSIEFFQKSGEFDSENEEKLYEWDTRRRPRSRGGCSPAARSCRGQRGP